MPSRELEGVVYARHQTLPGQAFEEALGVDRLGPDGGIHVDRLPGHTSRDDGNATDDHRGRGDVPERRDEGGQSFEQGLISPVSHG